MKPLVVLLISMIIGVLAAEDLETMPALQRPDVQAFIQEMADEHQYDVDQLNAFFAPISILTPAARQIERQRLKEHPKKPMTWQKYRRLSVTDQRIESGIAFWRGYRDALIRAQRTYGIPIEIIVAILGIETNYGAYQGKSPTLQLLTEKAFNEYPRSAFYRSELMHFLLLMRENQLPVLEIIGSHAGAMGYAQFIASSYRHYAIDFDGDGRVDLLTDPLDSIGSIANYLANHNWQPGEMIAYPLGDLATNTWAQQVAHHSPVIPASSTNFWRQHQVKTPPAANEQMKSAILVFTSDDQNEFWMGYANFYALTRYNHSNYYALAVYQLSQALKETAIITGIH